MTLEVDVIRFCYKLLFTLTLNVTRVTKLFENNIQLTHSYVVLHSIGSPVKVVEVQLDCLPYPRFVPNRAFEHFF